MATKEIKTWVVGEVFEDLYEVLEIFPAGGMGLVYRVRHRGWDIDLAMKQPRANWLETHPTFADFEHECDVWINLGLHPHVATCHYVRRIEGVPCIFAEFVEGGTLREWIVSRKLYRGGDDIARARILDIAIQFAWGLDWAHNHRLVHQDVKPGNVLVTADGTVKVTDFGLARARGANSASATFAGGTKPYYSPEQERSAPVTSATDIWSWAVSVFEMFTGLVWESGVARAALEQFRQRGLHERSRPPMTEALYDVLRHCFRTAPENRPASMNNIAARLIDIYQRDFGESYLREPADVDLLACDALNNRAVSLLDLGEQEKAMALLDEALRCDPFHPEATFNHGIILLRAAQTSDETLLGKLRKVADADPANSVPLQLVARVHLERGQKDSALLALQSAESIASDEGELRAIKGLVALAAKPVGDIRQEIGRPFVHAAPRTGAEYSRDAAHVKRLLVKAHAAHKAGRADDARRYLMRLRQIPLSKRHPEVRRLEETLWQKGKAQT